jgi:D-aminopeptidase
MGKKYMVRCDIEGVSGVVSYLQSEPGKEEFEFGRKMFMADLIGLVNGLNDGGAETIVVYDEHYYGRNVDLCVLPENVSVICGKPPYRRDWAGGLDETFDGLILLGFHSKRGTANGLLDHSYEPDIRNINLNGVSVGEIGIEAAIAGDYGVPLVMITGDSAGIEEAEKLIPGVVGAAVKTSVTNSGGICFSVKQTSKMIYDKACNIVKKAPDVRPYSVGNDVRLEITLNPGEFCETFNRLFKKDMLNETTVVIKGRNATEAWAGYWEMKLKCFEISGR